MLIAESGPDLVALGVAVIVFLIGALCAGGIAYLFRP